MRSTVLYLAILISPTVYAISNGSVLTSDSLPAVVPIEHKTTGLSGTGVVIGPNVILTAQSVVNGEPGDYQVNGLPVSDIFLSQSNVFAIGQDPLGLALIRVKGSLPPPLNLLKGPLEVAVAKIRVQIYGFGGAYNEAGELDSTPVKREGRQTLLADRESIKELFFRLLFEPGPFDAKKAAGILSGDVGAPMLWKGDVRAIATQSQFGVATFTNIRHPEVVKFFKRALKSGWQIPGMGSMPFGLECHLLKIK